MKICTFCHVEKDETEFFFADNRPRQPCKTCHVADMSRRRKARIHNKGTSESIKTRLYIKLRHIRLRAKKDGDEFILTSTWVWARLQELNFRCELTGLPMKMADGLNGHTWDSFSIDRIECDGGYTPQNVRFVLFCVNAFRGRMSLDQVYYVAQSLLEHRPLLAQNAE